MSTTGTFTFTTAHWVINRIHCNTSNMWSNALPAVTSRFSEFLTFVLTITNLTDTGTTGVVELTDLTGW
jgi:hypothetical protein